MERLASEILKDLTLYKQCHHCKRVNLSTNGVCHTCMFPQMDELSDLTIKNLVCSSNIGETVKITIFAKPAAKIQKEDALLSTIKNYVTKYPRENSEYFARWEVYELLEEYKQVDTVEFWTLLDIITDATCVYDTVLVEDVYTTITCIMMHKKDRQDEENKC